MLHYFHRGKTAAKANKIIRETYDVNTVSERTCLDWFARFKCGDFDVNDRPHSGWPETIEDKDFWIKIQHRRKKSLQDY